MLIQILSESRVDFGIARLLEPEHTEAVALKTRTGMWLMTPEFASPELVRRVEPDNEQLVKLEELIRLAEN